MDRVRWGVVGAGDVCERKSGPPLYRVDRSRISLVHRRNREAGEDFVRRHGHGRYVSSFEEILESPDIDAVYIATPHALHAEQTIAALEAGKHVLVEKPMALNTADCSAMIEAAAGLSLAVAYYRRGYPSINRISTITESDQYGKLTTMSINSEFPTSHRVDLVHALLGDIRRVRTIGAIGTGYYFELLGERFELEAIGGGTATMSGHWTESGMPEAMSIEYDTGSIHLTDLKGGELILRNRGEGGDATSDDFSIEHPGGLEYPHWGLIENFVDHLIDGVPLLCDGTEGRKSTVVLDALALAEPGGDWIEIEY